LVDGCLLAEFQVQLNVSDGCCVIFVAKEYAVRGCGLRPNSAIVQIMEIVLQDIKINIGANNKQIDKPFVQYTKKGWQSKRLVSL
jgi:hypothetical protein